MTDSVETAWSIKWQPFVGANAQRVRRIPVDYPIKLSDQVPGRKLPPILQYTNNFQIRIREPLTYRRCASPSKISPHCINRDGKSKFQWSHCGSILLIGRTSSNSQGSLKVKTSNLLLIVFPPPLISRYNKYPSSSRLSSPFPSRTSF